MSHYAFPVLYALFVWWFSTGVIIYLDGLPRRTFRWSLLGATAVFAASLWGLAAGGADTSVRGAYVAFTCGLLAWGWQEISFYMGYVTGPRTEPCPEGCAGWRHFGHAIQTSLWHELAIIAAAAAVVALTWGQPNQVGTWTFMVLWWMHQSAKLNVFLGVRNLNEEFLPEHLTFLKSFLTKKPMNLLFPVSVTISTVIAALLVQKAVAPGASAFDAAGYTFLGTLMALAILEHWFLVLPLPSQALWSWGLHSRAALQPFDVEVVGGFLGAGKTTYLRRLLAAADPGVRTVVLVNDFSAVGVDGSLLSGRGADVVELPNGCICCSLRKDLAVQVKEAVARWSPQRVLIEPSGVADLSVLVGALNGEELRPQIRSLRVASVFDAGAFLRDYARMPVHLEAQAAFASTLVVNKADLVSAAELLTVSDTLRALNPGAAIVPATYGAVQAGTLDGWAAEARRPAETQHRATSDHHHAEDHEHEHAHEDALGFQSWSGRLGGPCDPQGLRELLDAVARGAFGQVERVKGIARSGAGWVRFDVAGGQSSVAAFAPGDGEQPRVVAIGSTMDEDGLRAAFEACAAAA
jgi:putative photosynthetic complex assembly protein 2